MQDLISAKKTGLFRPSTLNFLACIYNLQEMQYIIDFIAKILILNMPLLHVITSIEMDGKVGDTICLIHIVLPYVILNFFLSKL